MRKFLALGMVSMASVTDSVVCKIEKSECAYVVSDFDFTPVSIVYEFEGVETYVMPFHVYPVASGKVAVLNKALKPIKIQIRVRLARDAI
jgi:hypothetical protein